MPDWREAAPHLNADHLEALTWFENRTGETVTWAELKDYAKDGARLVNQAKGIYKPAYTDYALSIRQTLNSPYADKEVVHRADGSWLYPYFQENSDPAQRDKEATNRGLVKCMEDGIPIAVLIQTKPKPGVQYEVLGLARVRNWSNGYFYLEGSNDVGELSTLGDVEDAAWDRVAADTLPNDEVSFDPKDNKDQRVRAIAEVVRRRGQAKFREQLLEAYSSTCAVTGCDAVEALEAAHITPYLGEETNHAQNGLLLRADIHSLFDLGLISIEPESLRVILSPSLENTSYGNLSRVKIATVQDTRSRPSSEALKQHLEWSGLA